MITTYQVRHVLAAVQEDGSLVTWGASTYGGDLRDAARGVVSVMATVPWRSGLRCFWSIE